MAAIEPKLDLASLMREHQAGVWRYVRALGAEAALADDITQETFLAVHQKPFEQRGKAETGAYLRVVARNLFLKSRRHAGKVINAAEIEQIDNRWSELVADDGSAMQAALKECLQTLDDKPRQALQLQYTQGLQRVEVAQQLGMTDDGVKTLLARTKARLKKCVELRVRGSLS